MFKKSLLGGGFSNNVIVSTKYNKQNYAKFKRIIKLSMITGGGLAVLAILVFSFWFGINVLKGLPDVKNIKDMIFSQASVITDRNGKELYKIFEENREYVAIDKVSKNMQNAIVSIEDKRFWDQKGLDPRGMLRAAIMRHGGASTLTQQLLKNLLLNPDLKRETTKQKVVRKLREIVLVSKLRSTLKDQVKNETKEYDDLDFEINKRVLELYLNYISFGNNAFGVETAAKTYFNKSAADLDVFESSVLASIPKGQGLYDPLKRPALVVGEIKISDDSGETVSLSGDILPTIKDKLQNILSQSDLSDKKENEQFVEFIKGVASFSIFYNGKNYYIKYSPGRKDSVLARMYEDEKIDANELKTAFIKGIGYKFSQPIFPIKAPHFVYWVKEILEKQYGKEKVLKGGWTITTTLDYDVQTIAEQILQKNKEKYIKNYGANNSAMVYIDSKNGDVLSYIGSIDFFNQEIDGQVDIIRSKRQVGSSIKPFIYALGFDKLRISLDTPIFDIPFKVGPDNPNDADGRFLGLLPLRKSLAYSRNIPAIKMFLALGGEAVAKPFLKKLGFSLIDNHEYGYPMALGAGEVQVLELANAYTHLSALGTPATIDPILEIKSSNGDIIYKKEVKQQEPVIKPGIASVLWRILSDKANMPPEWAGKYTVRGLTFGTKSGTSNMKTPKGDRARDGLLVTYTPSKVLIFRGGNTDGSPMFQNAFGGFFNAPAATEFWAELLKNNYIQNEIPKLVDVVGVRVNKLNGKSASASTPSEFIVDSSTYIGSAPGGDESTITSIQVDGLCNGKISPYTPQYETKKGFFFSPATSFMPNNMDLKDIKSRWALSSTPLSGDQVVDPEDNMKKEKVVYFKDFVIFTEDTNKECDGRTPREDKAITVNILKPTDEAEITKKFSLRFNAQGTRGINRVIVNVDEQQVGFFDYDGKKSVISDTKNITLDDSTKDGKHIVKVEVIDIGGYSNYKTFAINTIEKDTESPIILQDKINVKKTADGNYNVVILFEDRLSSIVGGKITTVGGKTIDFQGDMAAFSVVESDLGMMGLVVTDSYNNVLKQDLDLSKYSQITE